MSSLIMGIKQLWAKEKKMIVCRVSISPTSSATGKMGHKVEFSAE